MEALEGEISRIPRIFKHCDSNHPTCRFDLEGTNREVLTSGRILPISNAVDNFAKQYMILSVDCTALLIEWKVLAQLENPVNSNTSPL